MNFKRILEVSLCLILVVALLFNYTTPAHATSIGVAVGATAVGLSAPIAIGVILVCLGITVGVTSGAFDELVDRCTEAMTELGYVVDNTIIGYQFDDKTYVDEKLIEDVREFCFAENYVFDRTTVTADDVISAYTWIYPPKMDIRFQTLVSAINSYPYVVSLSRVGHGSDYSDLSQYYYYIDYIGCSYTPIRIDYTYSYGDRPDSAVAYPENGGKWNVFGSIDIYGNYIWRFTSDPIKTGFPADGLYADNLRIFQRADLLGTSTDLDLTLWDFAPSKYDVAERYKTWASKVLIVDLGDVSQDANENDKIRAYPINTTEDYKDVADLTKEDAQEGTISDGAVVEPIDYSNWLQRILNAITGIPSQIASFFTTVSEGFENVLYILQEVALYLERAIGDSLDAFLEDLIADLSTRFTEVTEAITSIPTKFETWFNDLKEALASLPELSEIPGILIDWVATAGEYLANLVSFVADFFVNLWSLLDEFASYLMECFADLLSGLFIPSEEFVDGLLDGMFDSIEVNGNFLDAFGLFYGFFEGLGSTPPVIYIDLGASDSYDIGGKTVFMDLSWYAEYKPTVDIILSAFLWLWFIWRLLHTLPGILQGTSGFFASMDTIRDNAALKTHA